MRLSNKGDFWAVVEGEGEKTVMLTRWYRNINLAIRALIQLSNQQEEQHS